MTPLWTSAREDAKDPSVDNPFLSQVQATSEQEDTKTNILTLRWFFHHLKLSIYSEKQLLHHLTILSQRARSAHLSHNSDPSITGGGIGESSGNSEGKNGGNLFANSNAKLQAETAILTRMLRTSSMYIKPFEAHLRLIFISTSRAHSADTVQPLYLVCMFT